MTPRTPLVSINSTTAAVNYIQIGSTSEETASDHILDKVISANFALIKSARVSILTGKSNYIGCTEVENVPKVAKPPCL